MTQLKKSLASFAMLWGATALSGSPALAASSAASSVSDSITTSVGSISGSFQKSSNSSSDNKVAAGDYRVVEVAAVSERPGTARLKLQAVADDSADGELYLYLPQVAFERSHLAPGQIVTARQRPYGLEFAAGQPQQTFFLALSDDWYRELQSNAVTL